MGDGMLWSGIGTAAARRGLILRLWFLLGIGGPCKVV
jgi:hypothetical protein